MATIHKNLSVIEGALPSASGMKFGIVVSEWNTQVTAALLDGAMRTLVAGTVELTLGAQFFAEYTDVDAVIALGCVVQGETRHFDYVCQSVTQGVTDVMLTWNMPVAFGVLTTDDMQQALDRAGGKYGNKGDEAAVAAIRMAALQLEMEQEDPDPGREREGERDRSRRNQNNVN